MGPKLNATKAQADSSATPLENQEKSRKPSIEEYVKRMKELGVEEGDPEELGAIIIAPYHNPSKKEDQEEEQ